MGLTSWNKGENFASLGIAHFIWYPPGSDGPFRESFPEMVYYLMSSGVKIPDWLFPPARCPWPDRQSFVSSFGSGRMEELRGLLEATANLQARYLAIRLRRALSGMLKSVPPCRRSAVERNFRRLSASPAGLYALMDYAAFKGDGTFPSERYAGEGWGLVQVLDGMLQTGKPLEEFSASAARVLSRRVELAPPGRCEARWLTGWLRRIRTYGQVVASRETVSGHPPLKRK